MHLLSAPLLSSMNYTTKTFFIPDQSEHEMVAYAYWLLKSMHHVHRCMITWGTLEVCTQLIDCTNLAIAPKVTGCHLVNLWYEPRKIKISHYAVYYTTGYHLAMCHKQLGPGTEYDFLVVKSTGALSEAPNGSTKHSDVWICSLVTIILCNLKLPYSIVKFKHKVCVS